MFFKKCLDMIKRFEGFRAKPYLCPGGKPTIGYGSTFYTEGVPVRLEDPEISQFAAEEMLRETVEGFWNSVDDLTENKLNGNQLTALTSFAYNVGLHAFKKSTLLKMVLLDPNDKLIHREFLRWNKSGTKDLEGLTIRRATEAELYFTPAET